MASGDPRRPGLRRLALVAIALGLLADCRSHQLDFGFVGGSGGLGGAPITTGGEGGVGLQTGQAGAAVGGGGQGGEAGGRGAGGPGGGGGNTAGAGGAPAGSGGSAGAGARAGAGAAAGSGGNVGPDGGVGGAGAAGGGAGAVGACTTESDCHPATLALHCYTGTAGTADTSTCVACLVDAHCTSPGFPRCNPTLHRCVACVAPADCGTGQTCVASHCLSTCSDQGGPSCGGSDSCDNGVCGLCGGDGTGCNATPATPLCLSPPRICVGCRTDKDCGPGTATPVCDPVRDTCVACKSSADCTSAAPFCDVRVGRCASGGG